MAFYRSSRTTSLRTLKCVQSAATPEASSQRPGGKIPGRDHPKHSEFRHLTPETLVGLNEIPNPVWPPDSKLSSCPNWVDQRPVRRDPRCPHSLLKVSR